MDISLVSVFNWPFDLKHPLMMMLIPNFLYPMENLLMNISAFLTISIAFERWLAVCKAIVHRDLEGTFLGGSCIHYIFCATLSCLLNIPKWFEAKVVEVPHFIGTKSSQRNDSTFWSTKPGHVHTDLRENPYYILFGMTLPRWIFISMGPLILLLTFSCLTLRGIKEFNARTNQTTNQVQITRITTCLVLEFIILNIPRNILIISEGFIAEEDDPEWFRCLLSVNNMLQILNSNLNFWFYAGLNNHFQEGLKSLIYSCRRSNPHSETPDPEAGTDTPVNMETHITLSEANRSNSKDVVLSTQIALNDSDCNGTEV
ncbi:FMRFamide receptor [Eurytemora carolleeae]|uniref:FMRFamide receptor n=1 Tax=Eurytemora carolleeae TaxID=1294199 RepID=UPI000C775428|nr:FMRFamide receptor [Eurytemora carolleeae]|eukprot:XP_023338634.1 FMRFamide receptor-like [Eurytemora affinis]